MNAALRVLSYPLRMVAYYGRAPDPGHGCALTIHTASKRPARKPRRRMRKSAAA